MDKRKILFICESYKIKPSPNGICVQNVAEKMASENIVSVVTLYNGINEPEYEEYNGVKIYRADPGPLRRMLFSTKGFFYQIVLRLSAFNGLIFARKYPMLSKIQVKNLFEKAESINKEIGFDYCVVVYQQIHPVLAGIKLKEKNKRLKLVLYSLDAISGGWVPTIARSQRIPLESLKRWEKLFFQRVDRFFAMESHRQYYTSNAEYEKYKNKIEYVDIPMVIWRQRQACKKSDSDKIHLVYTGSMSVNTANPSYLISIFHLLPDYIILDIYGRVTDDIRSRIENEGLLNKRIYLHGLVDHNQILDIQDSADVLVNFGNANPNMIPCKIFEYISSQNKILSFTHSEQDSSLPYMKKYPRALIVDETRDAASNVESILQFIQSENDCSVNKEKNQFKKNTPEYFIEKLFEI